MSSVKSIRADRALSILNLLLLIAVIVFITLKSGTNPWTDNTISGPSNTSMGFTTYCSVYRRDMTTYMRCWLTNGAWLGLLVSAFFWLLLAFYTFAQSSSDIYDDDYDAYDFKADVPMAISPASPPIHKTEPYEPATPTSYNPSHTPVQQPQPSSTAEYNYKYYNYPSYEGYYDPMYAQQQPANYSAYHSPAAVTPYSGYEYTGPSAYQTPTSKREDTVHMMSDMGESKSSYTVTSASQQKTPVTPISGIQKGSGFTTEPPHSHDNHK
ncbi:hypothetical protein EC973_007839 [Apophysomyces ossiformis]|uniref:Uncharacterized protein n=1 Tax=Apophysomyces ossiformis TaxID=679940 RepID=A0A8H7BTM5_9FUNG|nr:hypothetical protein EC973_007839 [Apophysomyces ossiformis]